MLGARQQKHTFETIAPFIREIKVRFPSMGARQLVTTLRQDYKLKVPEYVLSILLIFCSLTCVTCQENGAGLPEFDRTRGC